MKTVQKFGGKICIGFSPNVIKESFTLGSISVSPLSTHIVTGNKQHHIHMHVRRAMFASLPFAVSQTT